MYAHLFQESNELRSKATAAAATSEGGPTISVVMTCRDADDRLSQAVQSVLTQSYANWELIVIDDGSSPPLTRDAIGSLDERIRIYRTPKLGRGHALNHGLNMARSTWISFLDADNTMDPDFMRVMAHATACSPEASIHYCAQIRFSSAQVTVLFRRSFDHAALCAENFVDLNSLLVRADVIRERGGFDPRLTRLIDWDALIRWTAPLQQVRAVPFLGSLYDDGAGKARITQSEELAANLELVRYKIRNEYQDLLPSSAAPPRLRCNFCDHAGADFLPGGTHSAVFKRHALVGGGYRPHNLCPKCGSFDRERAMLRAILDRLSGQPPKRILHVAPEGKLPDALVRAFPDADIVFLDAYPKSPHIVQGDLTKLDFPDGHFDLVVCSHVLEHIEDDHQAFSELRRVLTPGGSAVLQTPYSKAIPWTLEDPQLAVSRESRAHWFGQDDHVRLYAFDDFLGRAERAGLEPDLVLQGAFADVDVNNESIQWFKRRADALTATGTNPPSALERLVERAGVPRSWVDEIGGWSIEADLILSVLDFVDNVESPRLLEFGSGMATKILAKIAKDRNGTLVSIEHDPLWVDRVRADLEACGLSDVVTTLHAPLVEQEFYGLKTKFYDPAVLQPLVPGFDVVLADGPPGSLSKYSRLNTLPTIAPLLNLDRFLFVLDDYERLDEKMIVELWRKVAPHLAFVPVRYRKQVCFVTSTPAAVLVDPIAA
jgi:predicted SAM-dependent methyltransferase